MSNIDKIAEAFGAELTGGRRPDGKRKAGEGVPLATPEVVLRTFARMGWQAHKYPARDTTSATGLPVWSLDAGRLILDTAIGEGVLYLDGVPLTDVQTTLDEYQQLAEGILAAVELARTLNTDPESEN